MTKTARVDGNGNEGGREMDGGGGRSRNGWTNGEAMTSNECELDS